MTDRTSGNFRRKRDSQQQSKQKLFFGAIVAVMLIFVVAGLVKVIQDDKKTKDTQQELQSSTDDTQSSEQKELPDKGTPPEQNPQSNPGTEDSKETNAGVLTVTPAPTPTITPTPVPTATPTPTLVPQDIPKVIIDPGHGGEDLGSVKYGLYEKDADLAIALFLKDILLGKGYDVYMIREIDQDVDNRSRPDTAVAQEGDVYISIHLNSLEEDSDATQGAEAWYSDLRDDNSDVLAQYVVDELTAVINTKNRGIKLSNGLIVLKYNGIPACLVECGFMSSETERTKLFTPEYQKQVAEGIANGIMKFLPIE